jgi:hypothetical protein
VESQRVVVDPVRLFLDDDTLLPRSPWQNARQPIQGTDLPGNSLQVFLFARRTDGRNQPRCPPLIEKEQHDSGLFQYTTLANISLKTLKRTLLPLEFI